MYSNKITDRVPALLKNIPPEHDTRKQPFPLQSQKMKNIPAVEECRNVDIDKVAGRGKEYIDILR